MRYTINQLAKLSGVSTRTLRFYDEIALLKPAYYGENQYRYYEKEQFLLLQQILFYRELGLPLNDIKRMVHSHDFDKVKALQAHKTILEACLERQITLIETIDKTIAYLSGDLEMKLEEIFTGFDSQKLEMYENFLIDHGVSKTVIHQSKQKIKDWSRADWLDHKAKADALHDDLATAIENNLSPSDSQVQSLIKQHFELTKKFWTPTKDTYIGLSELYTSHPDFVKFYDAIHPNLLSFLVEAMKIYAERNLD